MNSILHNGSSVVRPIFLKSLRVMVVSNLSLIVCSLVDGIVVSAFLSSEHMAAYGMTSPLLSIFMMVSYFFTSGLKNICSKLIGAGKVERANDMYSIAMVFLIVVSVVFSIALAAFKGAAADILGAGSNFAGLRQLTEEYILGLAPGIPAFCLTFAFSFVLYLSGNGEKASLIVVIQAGVDIICDLLSVFVFDGGLLGIGLATAASNIVAALLGIVFLAGTPNKLRFRLRRLHICDIKDIFKGGVPAAAEKLYIALRAALLNRIMLSIVSVEAVSAFAVVNSVSTFYGIISISTAGTVLPIASVFYGERDMRSLSELLETSVKLGVLLQSAVSLLAVMLARPIIALYCHDNSTVYSMAVTASILLALSLPITTINAIYRNYLHGVGRIMKTSLLSMCGNLIFRVICAYLLGLWLGHTGIWLSFLASELMTLLLEFIVASVRIGHPAVSISDWLELPDSFGGACDDLKCTARNIGEVVEASVRVAEYAELHGASRLEKYLLSLSAEEMGRNIVIWGFTGGKSHILDVRVLKNDGFWILRIRDDSCVIDPNRWVQIHHPEDELANMGFRMISAVAEDLTYTNSLGINNLIVKIKCRGET